MTWVLASDWSRVKMIPEEGYYQPEVIPWNGGHQLTEELAFMKKKVLPLLLTNALSGPFKLPVNAKAEGIYPDYFKVENHWSSIRFYGCKKDLRKNI